MNLSTLLKELRTDKGLTQSQLAEILGNTQDSISLWEKGKRLPDTQFILKLADFFEVTTDYLLGRSDELGYVTVQSSAPPLSDDEKQLIELYHKMNHQQKIRVVAYCEGLLSTSANSAKIRHTS